MGFFASSLTNCIDAALTDLAPGRSDAVVQAEVDDLAVAVVNVQLGKTEADPVARGHADLPLAHGVVGVRPRVAQRRQRPATGAQHCGAAAITCTKTTPPQQEGDFCVVVRARPQLGDQLTGCFNLTLMLHYLKTKGLFSTSEDPLLSLLQLRKTS